jgi:hypothetical protein
LAWTPPSVAKYWQGEFAQTHFLAPAGRVTAERGRYPNMVTLERMREVYERFPETPYAWYSALVLARFEADEVKAGVYEKPSRPGRAAGILESLEKRPLSLALREEVLALQANVYLLLGQPQRAQRCLKELEAMDPAEPLVSLIRQLRDDPPKPLPRNLHDAT